MKAAVVTSFTAPLEIQERDIPEPGADQVLIRMEACGLCHTDIHASQGDWPVKPKLPLVPGHEGVGIIEKLGSAVTDRTVGERVAIAWLGYACGECRYCIDGRETLCEKQQDSGYSIDGAFAEYAVASAKYVVPVPDGISSMDAAPLTCAGLTTYKALKVAHIRPTELVGVFGIGGLGHLGVQYAQIMGGTVVAIDIEKPKLDLAKELGATHAINAATSDPMVEIQKLGGLDVALVLAPSAKVFEQAFGSLRRGGRLVCVAMPAVGAMEIPIFETVIKGISIIGSIVGTRQDLAEVFALHAAGRTRVVEQARALDDVNASMAEVLSGAIPARLVFDFVHAPIAVA
ncbi:alcohol dehydrogenase AdhP [Lacisediminihabitans changchengi]|uniref:Alcohol dehydrogenase n=1 Tax=Lacisediminihabitans changchengi TaxID=2787634 RepID=A0A934SP06_9MICO|nr:alcohol dehydrogenase AdhP [Lacisediminihabitans changchengi]MBK4349048.1 alcohol dehydrogenase AdhP [Lacisediminihabitans changchengi]